MKQISLGVEADSSIFNLLSTNLNSESSSLLNTPLLLLRANPCSAMIFDRVKEQWSTVTDFSNAKKATQTLLKILERELSKEEIPKQIEHSIIAHFLDNTSTEHVPSDVKQRLVEEALWTRREEILEMLEFSEDAFVREVAAYSFLSLYSICTNYKAALLRKSSDSIFISNPDMLELCYTYELDCQTRRELPVFRYLAIGTGKSGFSGVCLVAAIKSENVDPLMNFIDKLPQEQQFIVLEGMSVIQKYPGDELEYLDEISNRIAEKLGKLLESSRSQSLKNRVQYIAEAHLTEMTDEVLSSRGKIFLEIAHPGISEDSLYDNLREALTTTKFDFEAEDDAERAFEVIRKGTLQEAKFILRELFRAIRKSRNLRLGTFNSEDLFKPFERFFEEYNLPKGVFLYILDNRLEGNWLKASSVSFREKAVVEHVRKIEAIEKILPGAASLLYRNFNIRAFGRYDTNLLLKMCETAKRMLEGRKLENPVYVFVAINDWDNALTEQEYIRDLSQQNENARNSRDLIISEFASLKELLRNGYKFRRKVAPLNDVVIDWHGGIYDRISCEKLFDDAKIEEKLTKFLGKLFKDKYTLILCGCYAGNKDSILDQWRPALKGKNGKVIAALNAAYVERVNLRNSKSGGFLSMYFTSNAKKPSLATRISQV